MFSLTALTWLWCNGKFEVLSKFLDITDYAEQSADHYCFDNSSDAQFPVFQEPGLLDVESYLHVQHTELIQEFEKSLENDAEFPCCTCERLLLSSYIHSVLTLRALNCFVVRKLVCKTKYARIYRLLRQEGDST